MEIFSTDLYTGILAFLFTVLILSYLIGDNLAFRLAAYIFTGVATGYVAAVALKQVILAKLILPLVFGDNIQRLWLVIPLLFSLLLLMKLSSGTEWLGRPVVAFLVGVVTAAAISGAVMGTLFPQIAESSALFIVAGKDPASAALGLVSGVFALIGTIATLAYFQFTVRGGVAYTGKRGWFMGLLAVLGQVFIAITLGAIFAGVLTAAITAFVDRIQFIVNFLENLIF